MFLKNKKIITVFAFVLIFVFGIGYKWGIEKYASAKNKDEKQQNELDKYTIISNVDRVLSSNIKILLKLRIKDNIKEVTVKELKAGELQNEISGRLTLKNVEDYFYNMGFKLFSNKEDEIIFVKQTRFEPEKYYLGATKDGFLAIFKCDDEGNLIVEDPAVDISEKKVEEFPLNDQESIKKFEFEFGSKEEASEELTAIIS